MKKLIPLFLLFNSFLFGQYGNGEELLKAMHDKHKGKYCQTLQFDQRTIRYNSDSTIKDTAYWHEWINYPDQFRIDFGKKYGGNCVIFKSDSSFRYKNHKLVSTDRNENDLLLLLGGMYFRNFEDVVARLEKLGYDLDKLTQININEKTFYVIGSHTEGDESKHQVWVDKKDLKVIKIKTKLNEIDWLEIRFEEFKKTCKGFTETKVSAYKNDILEQKEEYLNLKTSIAIPDSLFNKK